MATATVTGADVVMGKLAMRRERVLEVARASMYRFLLKVMTASDSIIPVATGRARSSHFVELPQISGDKIVARCGYGALDYILALHENLAAHHPHGQAKFLELAFAEYIGGAGAWLAADMREGLRTGRATLEPTMATEPGGA